MLSKRHRLATGKLSGLLVSGKGNGSVDAGASSRGPLELKIQSPPTSPARCLKWYDQAGGVGLGMVAALDKPSTDCGREILAKCLVCTSSSLNKSSQIPMRWIEEDLEMESLENYTYVTYHGHGQNKSFFTRVYYDGRGHGGKECKRSGIYKEMSTAATPRFLVEDVPGSRSVYPTSDFLNSCHLCRKKLSGKNIYMYRGEKAYCSIECRSTQIMMDERKEQCRPEDLSSSPNTVTSDYIFSTSILAI